MNAAAIAAFLQAAATILSATVTVVEDAVTVSGLVKKVIDQGEPTQADWDQLQTFQDANDAIINAPMDGETPPAAA